MMATMAAWTNSPAPGPTKVAPSTAPVCRSTASLASPWALPCRGSSGGRGVADLSSDDVLAGCLPDWLYAVSDASGEAQLTHMGKYRARAS